MKNRFRKRFRLLLVVHVAFLAASSLLLASLVVSTSHIAAPVVVGVAVLFQLLGLLHHVESHVDSLEEFFAAVNYDDFTRRFIEEDVDAELKQAFNRVLQRFQNARADREVQATYLETVVRHVPVPFIATRLGGKISLANNPARRLTGISSLSHVDQLAALDPDLPSAMQNVEPGQQRLVQSRMRGVPVELRISVSEIRIDGAVERLYSVENISGELTARESSAWRNLIRVLTHEIMNTLTPVTSLAQTTTGLLDDASAKNDVRDAVRTIARRSEGLTNFVLRYRELLKVPTPDPVTVSVEDTLQSIVTLLSTDLHQVKVTVDVEPKSLDVRADNTLLDQVLVNLIRNALDALDDQPSPAIRLTGRLDFGRVVIGISDNGSGIDAETIDQVFVPLFTTKREGSGIGLSLSRQIMTAHGGEIALQSSSEGTEVSLVF